MFEAGSRVWMTVAIIFFALFLAFGAHANEIRGVATVLSGDLLSVGKQKIRLFGVVAPSKTQSCLVNAAVMRCGIVSWAALIKTAEGVYLTCDIEESIPKKVGIIFATCYAGEHDIAEEHVRSGWAKALATQTGRYRVDEDDAKQSGRGLWVGKIIPDKKGSKEGLISNSKKNTPTNSVEKKTEVAKPQKPRATQEIRKDKKIDKKKAPKIVAPKKAVKAKKAKAIISKTKAVKSKSAKTVKKAKKAVRKRIATQKSITETLAKPRISVEEPKTEPDISLPEKQKASDAVVAGDSQKSEDPSGPEKKSFFGKLFGGSDTEPEPSKTPELLDPIDP
jgi:endonuclease YncB( thermonuclease family)